MSHPGTPMMTEVVGSTMRTGHCGTIPISLAYYVHPPGRGLEAGALGTTL
jgi:hypothetical protein